MHVGAHGCDRRPLPGAQVLGQQHRGRRLAPILPEPDHLVMHDIRQDGPELLPIAALNLIEADMRGRRFTRVASQSARNAFSARQALPQLTPWRTAA
jgi:hypothetical protein